MHSLFAGTSLRICRYYHQNLLQVIPSDLEGKTVYYSDEVFSLRIWGHFIQQCSTDFHWYDFFWDQKIVLLEDSLSLKQKCLDRYLLYHSHWYILQTSHCCFCVVLNYGHSFGPSSRTLHRSSIITVVEFQAFKPFTKKNSVLIFCIIFLLSKFFIISFGTLSKLLKHHSDY